MNRFGKKIFTVLLISASIIWIYDLSLILRVVFPESEGDKVRTSKAALEIPVSFVYKPDFRDPFFCREIMEAKQEKDIEVKKVKRVKKEEVKLPQCSIGGIVYNTSNPMALFEYKGGSKMIKEGDVVDSIRIVKITPDTVTVRYKSKRFFLKK